MAVNSPPAPVDPPGSNAAVTTGAFLGHGQHSTTPVSGPFATAQRPPPLRQHHYQHLPQWVCDMPLARGGGDAVPVPAAARAATTARRAGGGGDEQVARGEGVVMRLELHGAAGTVPQREQAQDAEDAADPHVAALHGLALGQSANVDPALRAAAVSTAMNGYYDRVISIIHEHGGDITHMTAELVVVVWLVDQGANSTNNNNFAAAQNGSSSGNATTAAGGSSAFPFPVTYPADLGEVPTVVSEGDAIATVTSSQQPSPHGETAGTAWCAAAAAGPTIGDLMARGAECALALCREALHSTIDVAAPGVLRTPRGSRGGDIDDGTSAPLAAPLLRTIITGRIGIAAGEVCRVLCGSAGRHKRWLSSVGGAACRRAAAACEASTSGAVCAHPSLAAAMHAAAEDPSLASADFDVCVVERPVPVVHNPPVAHTLSLERGDSFGRSSRPWARGHRAQDSTGDADDGGVAYVRVSLRGPRLMSVASIALPCPPCADDGGGGVGGGVRAASPRSSNASRGETSSERSGSGCARVVPPVAVGAWVGPAAGASASSSESGSPRGAHGHTHLKRRDSASVLGLRARLAAVERGAEAPAALLEAGGGPIRSPVHDIASPSALPVELALSPMSNAARSSGPSPLPQHAYPPELARFVYKGLLAGSTDEVRNVAVLWLSWGGYETPDALAALGRKLTRIVAYHRGYVDSLLWEGRVVTACVWFGIPYYYTPYDDKERAVACAVEISKEFTGRVAMGLAYGPAFCGVVGNGVRASYMVIGEAASHARSLGRFAMAAGTAETAFMMEERLCGMFEPSLPVVSLVEAASLAGSSSGGSWASFIPIHGVPPAHGNTLPNAMAASTAAVTLPPKAAAVNLQTLVADMDAVDVNLISDELLLDAEEHDHAARAHARGEGGGGAVWPFLRGRAARGSNATTGSADLAHSMVSSSMSASSHDRPRPMRAVSPAHSPVLMGRAPAVAPPPPPRPGLPRAQSATTMSTGVGQAQSGFRAVMSSSLSVSRNGGGGVGSHVAGARGTGGGGGRHDDSSSGSSGGPSAGVGVSSGMGSRTSSYARFSARSSFRRAENAWKRLKSSVKKSGQPLRASEAPKQMQPTGACVGRRQAKAVLARLLRALGGTHAHAHLDSPPLHSLPVEGMHGPGGEREGGKGAPHPRICLIPSAPGMGKTTLLRHFHEMVRQEGMLLIDFTPRTALVGIPNTWVRHIIRRIGVCMRDDKWLPRLIREAPELGHVKHRLLAPIRKKPPADPRTKQQQQQLQRARTGASSGQLLGGGSGSPTAPAADAVREVLSYNDLCVTFRFILRQLAAATAVRGFHENTVVLTMDNAHKVDVPTLAALMEAVDHVAHHDPATPRAGGGGGVAHAFAATPRAYAPGLHLPPVSPMETPQIGLVMTYTPSEGGMPCAGIGVPGGAAGFEGMGGAAMAAAASHGHSVTTRGGFPVPAPRRLSARSTASSPRRGGCSPRNGHRGSSSAHRRPSYATSARSGDDSVDDVASSVAFGGVDAVLTSEALLSGAWRGVLGHGGCEEDREVLVGDAHLLAEDLVASAARAPPLSQWVPLDGMAGDEVDEYVRALLKAHSVGGELHDVIVNSCGGSPLVMMATLQYLLEEDLIGVEEGVGIVYRPPAELETIALQTRAAALDSQALLSFTKVALSFPPAAVEVLRFASVVGAPFDMTLLRHLFQIARDGSSRGSRSPPPSSSDVSPQEPVHMLPPACDGVGAPTATFLPPVDEAELQSILALLVAYHVLCRCDDERFYDFAVDALPATLYASFTPRERAQHHCSIAEAMEGVWSTTKDLYSPEDVARHYYLGGYLDEAVAWFDIATDDAVQTANYGLAERLCELALQAHRRRGTLGGIFTAAFHGNGGGGGGMEDASTHLTLPHVTSQSSLTYRRSSLATPTEPMVPGGGVYGPVGSGSRSGDIANSDGAGAWDAGAASTHQHPTGSSSPPPSLPLSRSCLEVFHQLFSTGSPSPGGGPMGRQSTQSPPPPPQLTLPEPPATADRGYTPSGPRPPRLILQVDTGAAGGDELGGGGPGSAGNSPSHASRTTRKRQAALDPKGCAWSAHLDVSGTTHDDAPRNSIAALMDDDDRDTDRVTPLVKSTSMGNMSGRAGVGMRRAQTVGDIPVPQLVRTQTQQSFTDAASLAASGSIATTPTNRRGWMMFETRRSRIVLGGADDDRECEGGSERQWRWMRLRAAVGDTTGALSYLESAILGITHDDLLEAGTHEQLLLDAASRRRRAAWCCAGWGSAAAGPEDPSTTLPRLPWLSRRCEAVGFTALVGIAILTNDVELFSLATGRILRSCAGEGGGDGAPYRMPQRRASRARKRLQRQQARLFRADDVQAYKAWNRMLREGAAAAEQWAAGRVAHWDLPQCALLAWLAPLHTRLVATFMAAPLDMNADGGPAGAPAGLVDKGHAAKALGSGKGAKAREDPVEWTVQLAPLVAVGVGMMNGDAPRVEALLTQAEDLAEHTGVHHCVVLAGVLRQLARCMFKDTGASRHSAPHKRGFECATRRRPAWHATVRQQPAFSFIRSVTALSMGCLPGRRGRSSAFLERCLEDVLVHTATEWLLPVVLPALVHMLVVLIYLQAQGRVAHLLILRVVDTVLCPTFEAMAFSPYAPPLYAVAKAFHARLRKAPRYAPRGGAGSAGASGGAKTSPAPRDLAQLARTCDVPLVHHCVVHALHVWCGGSYKDTVRACAAMHGFASYDVQH